MDKSSFFLLFIAAGVFPVSLIYGFNPLLSMPFFYGIEIININMLNILRAIMGLYIALCIFWCIGAFYNSLKLSALWSCTIFMLGIGFGRILSISFDGMPSSIFVFYLVFEIIAGLIGLKLITDLKKST